MSESGNCLYVIATPLGNLGDMSFRAVETLRKVDLVAVEDTRRSGQLLSHYGISTPMLSLHEHNEEQRVKDLIERIHSGKSIAIISDAGTPLISDPGYRLVCAALDEGIRVIPIPGSSAVITALSVSGLATDRFVFEGFLPARGSARRARLSSLKDEARTQIFYESCHRVIDCISDMQQIYGANRLAVIARELTKTFESVRRGSLSELGCWLEEDANHQRGEFVLLVSGAEQEEGNSTHHETLRILRVLMGEMPIKQAVQIAVTITGRKKNELYAQALQISQEHEIP